VVEASISDHRAALATGQVTSVELVISYLIRIAKYDIEGGELENGHVVQPLNAFTIFNPKVLEEAAASDARRASGLPLRFLEGIPYTLKDSYSYQGLTVTNGSPALEGVESREDSAIASRFRAAGAVLIGKTNMPPMAAGGMQRGLYGRAESPYNSRYLTAAFSSGSSNGAATATASSMGVFGMASETVSSGRSAASNNALVCYTPSRGIVSCRGLWPLYVTCDTPVPFARSIEDLLDITAVIAEPDPETKGDFWREQQHIELPRPTEVHYPSLTQADALKGKRIGVPKLYVGQQDSDPHAKPTVVSKDVIDLWGKAKAVFEALGAEIVYTDFPLVTNYENDSVSKEANNVVGTPSDWNHVERSSLIAKAWDEFLVLNNDKKLSRLSDVNAHLLFPKPPGYIPDTFLEVRNWINYPGLPDLAKQLQDTPLQDHPGLAQALESLEAQRKRDLEDWMDQQKLDCVVFPANGDVGFADLEFNLESATHSLKNGVKYSNGNRAIRHLGVPTVSVPMGIMPTREMPVNLTFAGKAYEDHKLLRFAYAYEQGSRQRTIPPLTPHLESDNIPCTFNPIKTPTDRTLAFTTSVTTDSSPKDVTIELSVSFAEQESWVDRDVEVWVNGSRVYQKQTEGNPKLSMSDRYTYSESVCLGWDLKPLPRKPVMVLVVARADFAPTFADLQWVC
jgi:Asp-tRNA(Asn)/Glu-tRNA(Gln) amidotransferase A subunit family amidase